MKKEIRFKLPDHSENLIRLQRTSSFEGELETFYYDSALEDYNSIKSSLNEYDSVLDIGCGLGGIDYFLGKRNPKAKLHLMDKSEVETKIYYGYQNKGCFYNNLDITERFLIDNAVSNDLTFIDVGENYVFPEKVDLVISLISWGFHYPIETYLDQVGSILSDKGIIIVDIRKTIYDESVELFQDLDYEVEIIFERAKYLRIKAHKPKSL